MRPKRVMPARPCRASRPFRAAGFFAAVRGPCARAAVRRWCSPERPCRRH